MEQFLKLTVNGQPWQFDAPLTGAQLLEQLGIPPATVVCELNGAIIPRERFVEMALADGDALELVTLVGGG